MASYFTISQTVGVPEFQISQLMSKHCCNRKNVTCFSKLSHQDIDYTRQEFYNLETETLQNQHVLDYFRRHSSYASKSVLFSVAGKSVCSTCWRMVYGIRYNKFTSLMKKFQEGVIVAQHGHLGSSRVTTVTLRTTSSFFLKVGDHMPMSSDIHLPSCLTKLDVFELAHDDLLQGGLQCSSLSQFYSIWSLEFPHVKIPKV